MLSPKLENTYRSLHIVYAVVPIVAGVDKFTRLLANWASYLSPFARSLLPIPPQTFMYTVGVIEIAAGLLVLIKPRIGAWVVAAWLLAIALNLIIGGFLDIAVRDIAMAFGAGALARLAEARAPARNDATTPIAREAQGHAQIARQSSRWSGHRHRSSPTPDPALLAPSPGARGQLGVERRRRRPQKHRGAQVAFPTPTAPGHALGEGTEIGVIENDQRVWDTQ